MKQLYVIYAQDPSRKWIMIRITGQIDKKSVDSISENLVNYVVKEV